jgi:maltose/maltodextrin transport system substrate-binding protein
LRLLVWINGDKGYNGLQKVGDAFAAESGVPVTVQHPEDAPSKFQQAVAAGKGPDIFCWPHDRVGRMGQVGAHRSDHAEPQAARRDRRHRLARLLLPGQDLGLPARDRSDRLVYNKALVKTPPQSFDDVIKLDKALAAQGKKAILWDYNKSFFSWPLLAGGGGFVFGRDDKGGLDAAPGRREHRGAVEAAEMLRGLVSNGQMPRGANYADMEAASAAAKWR